MPNPFLIPAAIGAGVNLLGGLFGQNKQSDHNMELAKFQASANEKYLDKYNEYNSPANQMKRFQDAGLNPHLIYGQGSPGNQSAPLQHPDIKPTDMQQVFQSLGPLANQTALAQSQVQATNANTLKTGAQTDLIKLQSQVLANNPMLNADAVKATIDTIISGASIKASEAKIQDNVAGILTDKNWYERGGKLEYATNGYRKFQAEVDLLEQRFHLGTLDAKLKNEVLTSKQFANYLSEIQVKWMQDGDMTPQHFYQLAQIILMKLMGR